jgi:hypothetical protein
MLSKAVAGLLIPFILFGVALAHAGDKREVEEITGVIVAYDNSKWAWSECYGACGQSVIVRVRTSDEARPRYIRVDFRARDQKMPKEMVESVRRGEPLRFKLIRTRGLDEPIADFIRYLNDDNSVRKEFPIWIPVEGAGGVKLPIGERLPSYSLIKGGLKVVGGR